VLEETQIFVSHLGVEWKSNLPLAPWHGGFFERLVKSTKELLRKQLRNLRLNYEELQTILFEVELILNNRPITYYYSDDSEECLTRNHMLFGRKLNLFEPEPRDITTNIINSRKINNIVNHFWERWRKEYLGNLREQQKTKHSNKNRAIISINDVVLVEDNLRPRCTWKMGVILETIKGKDNNVRGAKVRITKTNSTIIRPINKLYPIEYTSDSDSSEQLVNSKERPKRQAAIIGDIRRKFVNN